MLIYTKISFILLIGLFGSACAINKTSPDFESQCTEPRPQMCTMNYLPVCGLQTDKTSKTYSNACSACSDSKVIAYSLGKCL